MEGGTGTDNMGTIKKDVKRVKMKKMKKKKL